MTERPEPDFWAALSAKGAERWDRIKAVMLKAGYDVDAAGACLLMPTSYLVIDPPDWVFMTTAPDIEVPSMSKTRPVLDAGRKRLLFWMCPARCGHAITWDKTVQPSVARCGCGLSNDPGDKIKTYRALAALDTMATVWAAQFDIRRAVRAMISLPDGDDRLIAFIKHAHAEGLYDGFTARQDIQSESDRHPSGIPPG